MSSDHLGPVGLTIWHQTRLEEEDIENVPNMATADLVEMFLNTKFPPDRVVDWVDQAVLFTALGSERKSSKTKKSETKKQGDNNSTEGKSDRELLRKHGIRTASALISRFEYTKDNLTKNKLNVCFGFETFFCKFS